MILSYDIAVDLTPEFNRQLSPKFSVSLGDHGAREYTVRVLQGGEPYEIEEGSTVSIVGKKPDGHIFAYACTYADEYVYFTIEEQMTPVSGIVTCELSIIDASGNKVGSANFMYWVEPSPVTDGEASESDLQLFQQLLDAADDLDDVREILDRAVPIAEQLGDVEKLLTAFPTEETSGSIIALTDGADGIPAKKVTLNLSPHQSGSGDPSPENVRPISGYTAVKVTRAGKNLLKNVMSNGERYGINYTRNADGSITASGTSTSTNVTIISGQTVRLPKGTYILSGGNAMVALRCNRYNAADEIIDRISNVSTSMQIVVDDTVDYLRFYVYTPTAGTTVDNFVVYPLLRAASFADDTYEPYTADTYDITIPTAAGTVYGGSLEINDDGSGTLTVDRGFVNLTGGSNEDWRESTADYYCRFSSAIFNGKTPEQNTEDILCNRFIGSNTQGMHTGSAGLAVRKAQFPDTVTSLAECVAWVQSNNLECVYPLATPQTYTLTASQVVTLLGDNTLWMDADGSIDLTYRADTQKYIDSRIALLNSNLAFIEDGMTASRAYSVGQYVLIGGQLYRVTSAISSGATFTIGTNVVSTTVGAELTALNN